MSRTAPEPGQRPPELQRRGRCGAGFRGCEFRGELRPDPFDRNATGRQIYRYLCGPCTKKLADF